MEFDSILDKKRRGVISPAKGEMTAIIEGFIKKGSLVRVMQPSANPFENKGKSYVDRVDEWSYAVNPTKKGISDEEAFEDLYLGSFNKP